MKPELYVLLDKNDKLVLGGGSSTKAYIRVYDSPESAARGLRYFRGCRIVKYTYLEDLEQCPQKPESH